MNMKRRVPSSVFLPAAIAALGASVGACDSGTTGFRDVPAAITVDVTSGLPTDGTKLPISFQLSNAQTFTIDVRVLDEHGNVKTDFDGKDAWVHLSIAPTGTIVGSEGPGGPDDSSAFADNVHVTKGEIHGVKVKVVGAFGDSRIVAEDIGYTPVALGSPSQCTDGIDNDNNLYADWPTDPGCSFPNDDNESTPSGAYGVSNQSLPYVYPHVRDIMTGNPSPFTGRQIELLGDHRMIVNSVSASGMYVTDIDDPMGNTNSLFVYNFSAPQNVRVCDTLSRLAGNVANFYGETQLGTPAWTNVPWYGPSVSGPCLVPDAVELTKLAWSLSSPPKVGDFAPILSPYYSSLVQVTNPTVGTHFGSKLAPMGTPADGASNCDLNGDGIVGFSTSKPGYSAAEAACNTACESDPDCTEWNDWITRAHVKISFNSGAAVLFATVSAIPNLDVTTLVGANKIALLRGNLTTFVGPVPPNTIEPRCIDDLVLVGTTPKDDRSACVNVRSN
jgi:hypothetical protein